MLVGNYICKVNYIEKCISKQFYIINKMIKLQSHSTLQLQYTQLEFKNYKVLTWTEYMRWC